MDNSNLIDLIGINRYFGDLHALKDVTLQLPPGRIGLLGPNGAGKSTLLKILMGLLPPSSGQGRVLNQNLNIGSSDEGNWVLRRLIGFMPEADALVPGMRGIDFVSLAGELYGMPRRQAQRRAHEVLTYLELEDARYRRVEEYSLGMKQRVKLAQAIVHDPPVLLLDEPTSGLDPAGRDAMLRLLRELGVEYGKSLLLTTHLLADVETVCERVVIMDAGRVCGQGSTVELCARRQDRYLLRIQGDPIPFAEQLRLEGVDVLSKNEQGELRVRVPETWTNRRFFDVAEQNAVVVRGCRREDESLEEFFMRTVSVPPAGEDRR